MTKNYKLMSTRYSNYGINTTSDVEIFKATIKIKNKKKQIYHIRLDYNNEKSAWDTLNFFIKNVYPQINNYFVMIITGEDLTIPTQIDPRWQKKEQLNLIKQTYDLIINHPLLIHCYIENKDLNHNKTSSIPLGINPREMPNRNIDYIEKYMHDIPKIKNRVLKVICIHRPRKGDRELINKLKINWINLIITEKYYRHDTWYKLLQKYSFIICAHGGGIDLCPKIWEALCVGCIPIIKHSTLDDIYDEFPVIYVDSWEKDTITLEKLKKWINEYSKYFDNSDIRKTWTNKLFLDYWKHKILSHFL